MTNKAIFLNADGALNVAMLKNGKLAAPTKLADLVMPDKDDK